MARARRNAMPTRINGLIPRAPHYVRVIAHEGSSYRLGFHELRPGTMGFETEMAIGMFKPHSISTAKLAEWNRIALEYEGLQRELEAIRKRDLDDYLQERHRIEGIEIQ